MTRRQAPSGRAVMFLAGTLFLCIFRGLPAEDGSGLPARSLRVLYTASLNGNMDGCDCASNPRAGLIKRASFLGTLPDRDRAVLVDAGDLLDVYPDRLLSDLITETYRGLGYDAVAVGDQDFSSGIPALLEYRKRLPLLSGNLAVCPDEKSCILFSPSPRFVERAGVKVAIQSILDPGSFILYPGETGPGVKLADPAVALESFLRYARDERADVSLLLFHGRYEDARDVVARTSAGSGLVPDVVVVGHEQRLLPAAVSDGTIYVSPGPEGNRVGMLDLAVGPRDVQLVENRFRRIDFHSDPDDPVSAAGYGEYLEEMKRRIRTR